MRFAFAGDGRYAGDGGDELQRLYALHRWKAIGGCDGRYAAKGKQLTPLDLAALCDRWSVATCSPILRCDDSAGRDAASCVRLRGGGGLLTYSKPDGATHVHTLNTESGLARKLLARGGLSSCSRLAASFASSHAALLFSSLCALLEHIPDDGERTRSAPAVAVALRFTLARGQCEPSRSSGGSAAGGGAPKVEPAPPGFVLLPGVRAPAPGCAVAATTPCGRRVAVFARREQLYAIDAECPHQGAPLETGDIEDDAGTSGPCVTCPRHGWRFELRSGYCEDLDDYGLRAYEAKRLADGRLCVAEEARPQPDRT